MKRRWVIYIIVGILFGIFDFYYHGFISNAGAQNYSNRTGEITWLVLSIGIWLVPIIPVAIYETKISRSRVLSALASSSTWCISIVSYYLTNAVELALIGVPTRPELHISNHSAPFFWSNWENILLHDIGGSIIEWTGIAVVGGFIIGFLVSSVCLLKKRRIY